MNNIFQSKCILITSGSSMF